MIRQEVVDKLKKEIEEFFDKMGFETTIELSQAQDQVLSVDVRAQEPQILIGERGETLSEIQHLMRMVLRKTLRQAQSKEEEPFYLDLDVNDYKKKKTEYLKEVAKDAAEEVLLTKKEKELPPMSSYERRIVHMALAERQDVVSESAGEGQDRRVVVKPRF